MSNSLNRKKYIKLFLKKKLHLWNDKTLFSNDSCGKRATRLLLEKRQDPVLSPSGKKLETINKDFSNKI